MVRILFYRSILSTDDTDIKTPKSLGAGVVIKVQRTMGYVMVVVKESIRVDLWPTGKNSEKIEGVSQWAQEMGGFRLPRREMVAAVSGSEGRKL